MTLDGRLTLEGSAEPSAEPSARRTGRSSPAGGPAWVCTTRTARDGHQAAPLTLPSPADDDCLCDERGGHVVRASGRSGAQVDARASGQAGAGETKARCFPMRALHAESDNAA